MNTIKRAEFVKIDQELLENIPAPKLPDIFRADISRPYSTYDRGMLYRPFDPRTLKIGYDGDDFVRNLITVVCDQRVYRKVPRILQAVYRVEKYKPRGNHAQYNRKKFVINPKKLKFLNRGPIESLI